MNGILDKRKNSPLHKSEEQPSQMSESEELLLRKKIQIKTQALMMLSQELDQCRMQRDRFKLAAEQLQEDLDRRKQMPDNKVVNGYRITSNAAYRRDQDKSKADNVEEDTKIMDLLIEAREKNKCLRLQVDTLRQKLKEAEEDIKALRSKKTESFRPPSEITPALHQREELIEQLEKLNVRYRQLKLDLQSILDEKQELEMERDAFKCKAHRLNYELSKALSASKPVDVDALVNENRYLQERLQQLLEEKELAQQSVQKYKSMLDSKRQKGTIKLGGKSSVGSIMTFKQVEQLLQQGPNIPPQKSAAALSELHSLCAALLEALNDKNLALAHQKKANKILAARMCELDRVIQSPTMKLLEGYSSADVDTRCDSTSCASDLSEERSDDKESDLQCDESLTERDSSKPSEESSIDQSVKNKESDDYFTENNVKLTDENNVELDVNIKQSDESDMGLNEKSKSTEESNVELADERELKSFGLFSKEFLSNDDEPIINNFEEVVLSSLPEHLRLLVQKNLDELRGAEGES